VKRDRLIRWAIHTCPLAIAMGSALGTFPVAAQEQPAKPAADQAPKLELQTKDTQIQVEEIEIQVDAKKDVPPIAQKVLRMQDNGQVVAVEVMPDAQGRARVKMVPLQPAIPVMKPAERVRVAVKNTVDLTRFNSVDEAELHCAKLEVEFVRRVCQLSPEQESDLQALDFVWLAKARAQADLPRASVRSTAATQSLDKIHRRSVLILKSKLKSVLTPTQMEQYVTESKLRDQFAAKAKADYAVAILDERLALRDSQKEAIRKELLANELEVDTLLVVDTQNHLPPLPESAILPHLDDIQTQLYRRIKKVQLSVTDEKRLPDILTVR
jgi:hypothetical protein